MATKQELMDVVKLAKLKNSSVVILRLQPRLDLVYVSSPVYLDIITG
jgi:hypothetical protein